MSPGLPLFVRIVLIGGIVAAMLVAIPTGLSLLRDLRRGSDHPPVPSAAAPGAPIPAEAGPYLTRPARVAVDPSVARRPQAQPRTLEIHRSLRAYPGAPPRIPHGLTDREFRETRCNSCHERGGFVPRFGTYTPLTPHPGWSNCLQCHAPDAMTVGLGLPSLSDEVICRQCHVNPDQPPPSLVSVDWAPMAWPELGRRATEMSPHWIPHPLQNRGNCLACHGGPSAVEGIRTTHPERVDCRSCHVPVDEPEPTAFSRPLDGASR